MTNKRANEHFKKIKDSMKSCENHEQLKNVMNMIETFIKTMPNAIEERVRLLFLYNEKEKEFTNQ